MWPNRWLTRKIRSRYQNCSKNHRLSDANRGHLGHNIHFLQSRIWSNTQGEPIALSRSKISKTQIRLWHVSRTLGFLSDIKKNQKHLRKFMLKTRHFSEFRTSFGSKIGPPTREISILQVGNEFSKRIPGNKTRLTLLNVYRSKRIQISPNFWHISRDT